MQLATISDQSKYGSAFDTVISSDALRARAPAAYASSAHERTSKFYKFISTEKVVSALGNAGFQPVEARQATPRKSTPEHARHLIRFRRRLETVALKEAVPEIWFLNSHDGSSAYNLRVGLFRAICTNGLVVSVGTLPVWRVPHRGDILDDVVRGALELSEHFSALAPVVERMQTRILTDVERSYFARAALALRFPDDAPGQMNEEDLLVPRRAGDAGNDLWRTLNVIQEGILRGGLPRRTATNRRVHSRGIRAINEDVRLNTALWDMALALAA